MDMHTEPARVVGLITAGAVALLAVLVAYGVPIDDSQSAAILGVVAVLAPVVAGWVIRRYVRPAATSIAAPESEA